MNKNAKIHMILTRWVIKLEFRQHCQWVASGDTSKKWHYTNKPSYHPVTPQWDPSCSPFIPIELQCRQNTPLPPLESHEHSDKITSCSSQGDRLYQYGALLYTRLSPHRKKVRGNKGDTRQKKIYAVYFYVLYITAACMKMVHLLDNKKVLQEVSKTGCMTPSLRSWNRKLIMLSVDQHHMTQWNAKGFK